MEQRPSAFLTPFGSRQADAMRDALAARIDNDEPSAVWASRAHTFADPIAPVLCGAHDTKGLDPVADFPGFDNLVAIAGDEPVRVGRGAALSGWAELPDSSGSRVRRYLAGLPGFMPGATMRRGSAARVIHAHARYDLCLSFQRSRAPATPGRPRSLPCRPPGAAIRDPSCGASRTV